MLVGGTWATVKFTSDYLLYLDATTTARNWAHSASRLRLRHGGRSISLRGNYCYRLAAASLEFAD